MRNTILLGLSLLCGLLLIAACGHLPGGGDSTANTSPAKANADPRGSLSDALNAMLNAKSYRAHVVSTNSRGTTNMVAEFVAPDRYHMTIDIEAQGRGSMKQEMLIIGKESYVKIGDTPWRKFPMNMGEMLTQFRDPKVIAELSKGADVKFVGSDTLDGLPTYVYEYAFNDPKHNDFKSRSKTWVGVGDHLPRKTESEGEMNISGAPITTKTTITYSDFGANISIEPPL